MSPRRFLESVAVVVLVGIVVHLTASYIADRFPGSLPFVAVLAGITLLVLVLGVLGRAAFLRLTGSRYAIEALVLNHHNELLMYHHPFHKRMLPPGGRLKPTEFPTDALASRLEWRVGLKPGQYEFDSRFHHGLGTNVGNLGDVMRYPAPWLFQREIHRQRRWIRTHYDLIYVLRLKDDTYAPPSGSRYEPIQFVDITALVEMVAQQRTLPDVLDAYRRILEITAGIT